MRFMIIVRSDEEDERGCEPTEEDFLRMGRYNDELLKAGALLAMEGLRPSADGARITFGGETPVVTDGPFAEAKELIAGFWLIQARSRDEAIEWARRIPFTRGEVEVRPAFEWEDFGAAGTPEVRAMEERQRAALANAA